MAWVKKKKDVDVNIETLEKRQKHNWWWVFMPLLFLFAWFALMWFSINVITDMGNATFTDVSWRSIILSIVIPIIAVIVSTGIATCFFIMGTVKEYDIMNKDRYYNILIYLKRQHEGGEKKNDRNNEDRASTDGVSG